MPPGVVINPQNKKQEPRYTTTSDSESFGRQVSDLCTNDPTAVFKMAHDYKTIQSGSKAILDVKVKEIAMEYENKVNEERARVEHDEERGGALLGKKVKTLYEEMREMQLEKERSVRTKSSAEMMGWKGSGGKKGMAKEAVLKRELLVKEEVQEVDNIGNWKWDYSNDGSKFGQKVPESPRGTPIKYDF